MKKLTTTEDVYGLLYAPPASAALGTAIETGLLWMLAENPMDGDGVAKALKIPGKRAHYWLQYLHSLGILDSVPQGYVPSSLAHTAILDTHSQESWQHLVLDERERTTCIQGLSQFISELGSLWIVQKLAEPKDYVDKMRASPERAREFTRMLFDVHQGLANDIADLLDLINVQRMMDLGGGSGVVSMALLRKHPSLISTVVDIENVCIVGREIAAEVGLSERISYHAAEFAIDDLPTGFDLVLQCDVGVFGTELYEKLWSTLKLGGRLVLVEHFSPDENSAPPTRVEWTFLDSLHDSDFSFPTIDQVETQLLQAGFEVSPEQHRFGKGWVALQACKKDKSFRRI